MKQIVWVASAVAMSVVFPQGVKVKAQVGLSGQPPAYLGFDRNDYPGEESLRLLRQTFSYTGFWLNHPPERKQTPGPGNGGCSSLLDSDFWFSSTGDFSPS